MNRARCLGSFGVASRPLAYLSSLVMLGTFALPVVAQVFDHPSNGAATINPLKLLGRRNWPMRWPTYFPSLRSMTRSCRLVPAILGI